MGRSGEGDQGRNRARGSLYVTAIAILVGFISVAVVTLGLVGLRAFNDVNETNGLIRVDRAGRAAAEASTWLDFDIVCTTEDGSPTSLLIGDPSVLEPDPVWDDFVDRVSNINQGAANVFVLADDGKAFDRVATSFRDPDGRRMQEGTVLPGAVSPQHPAYADLIAGRAFVGEVPVGDQFRLAYLTPLVTEDDAVVGAIAVDVGSVDDLNRVNADTARDVAVATSILLMVTLLLGATFMTRAFRPLRALGQVAGQVGRGEAVHDVPYRNRQNDIGNIADGLAQVVALQRELKDLAYVDELSGLPNRARFKVELEARVAAAVSDPEHESFALLLLDLDQFKQVNDALGHAAGDALLASVAKRLEQMDLDGALRARIGGDEFAIVTSGPAGDEEVTAIAASVNAVLAQVDVPGTGEFRVGCSIGIARVPEDATTSAEALSHADLALYKAKRSGRARHEFYRAALATDAQRRLHLMAELGRAVDAGEIRIDLQPQFGLDADRLVGFEALARWDHPTDGAISPTEFIEVAESSGLITEIGEHVLDLSLQAARDLKADAVDFSVMAVNVSPIQLWSPSFYDAVRDGLARYDLDPSLLCLEVTENVLVDDGDMRIWEGLRQLAGLGVRLSIDDFGTGYCSLSYLDDLSFNQVKVDRSFIAGVDRSPRRIELLTGIVSLGHSLGLEVVVEGIERREELAVVVGLGADAAQGYLLGRPGARADVGRIATNGSVAAALAGTDAG